MPKMLLSDLNNRMRYGCPTAAELAAYRAAGYVIHEDEFGWDHVKRTMPKEDWPLMEARLKEWGMWPYGVTG